MFRNYYSLNLHVADSRWVEVSWTLNATRLFLAPLLLAENSPLTLICPSYRLFLQTLGTDFVQRLYFAFSSVFATFSLSHIRHFLAHVTRFCSFFLFLSTFLVFSSVQYIKLPSVLWCCWLGGRNGIRPVKNWVVGCWRGYLSGARCRLAYVPADATATHCLLLQ